MFQKFMHMNFPIEKLPRYSNIFGLADTADALNLGYLDYNQSVAERHPNLVLNFSYLKNMDNMDQLNVSGVDVVK